MMSETVCAFASSASIALRCACSFARRAWRITCGPWIGGTTLELGLEAEPPPLAWSGTPLTGAAAPVDELYLMDAGREVPAVLPELLPPHAAAATRIPMRTARMTK